MARFSSADDAPAVCRTPHEVGRASHAVGETGEPLADDVDTTQTHEGGDRSGLSRHERISRADARVEVGDSTGETHVVASSRLALPSCNNRRRKASSGSRAVVGGSARPVIGRQAHGKRPFLEKGEAERR